MADDLQAKREEARRALEGEDRQKQRSAQADQMLVRRREAGLAMESTERRQRRETAENLLRQKQVQIETEQAKLHASVVNEKLEKEKAEQAIRREAEVAKEDLATRLTKIHESQTTIEQIKQGQVRLNSLRTLKTDLVQAVNEEKISLTRAAIQEQERGRRRREAERSAGWSAALMLVLILALVAGGGVIYWQRYRGQQPTTPAPTSLIDQTLIFAEQSRGLDTTNWSPREFRHQAQTALELAASQPAGRLENISFTTAGQPLRSGDWFKKAEIGPIIKSGNYLGNKFMYGLASGPTAAGFLFFETDLYEQAFSTLLGWEKNMPDDLDDFLILKATSTPPLPDPIVFRDKVIRNIDTRHLTTTAGQTIMLYAFLDRRHIVITSNESLFAEIVSRFHNRPQ
ncbi:MAG: hypothetical protein AAB468_00885 [Patescibacteria group bacterium]|mgnify:CR=1 FL=1